MPAKKRRIVSRTRAKAKRKTLATSKPGKSSYSVRELSSKTHAKISGFITDMENHVEEIDALKDRRDVWAAEIFGNKTYKVFGSIKGLAHQLASYRGLQEEHPRKAIDKVKVFRLNRRARSQWEKARDIATQEKAQRHLEVSRRRRKERALHERTKKENLSLKKREKKLKAEIKRLRKPKKKPVKKPLKKSKKKSKNSKRR